MSHREVLPGSFHKLLATIFAPPDYFSEAASSVERVLRPKLNINIGRVAMKSKTMAEKRLASTVHSGLLVAKLITCDALHVSSL